MYTITRNLCLNHLKARERLVSVDFNDEETVNGLGLYERDTPSDAQALGDELMTIARRLLSPREFMVLISHAVGEQTFGEIARLNGGLETTTRWQYFNAVKKLRKEYERIHGSKH